MKKFLVIAAAAAMLLCACKSRQESSTMGPITTGDDCIVQVTSGKILGYNDAGIYTFKGVPYANAERFMPPQAPDSWDGIRKTQVYGPQAMQGQNMMWGGQPSDYDFGFQFKKELNSEDCQMLNIWTPALDGKKRPVFVWIHGGGYANGSAIFLPAQEGRALAEKGDIVVVTVNHRLNILGYIDLTALGGKYSESVNLGQQDLVKALEWIHGNIGRFGGDPDCVTIGGQSGGGGKTSTLMAMPSAKGLFHRAIVQSGSTLRQQEPEQSRALGIAVVEELGLKPSPPAGSDAEASPPSSTANISSSIPSTRWRPSAARTFRCSSVPTSMSSAIPTMFPSQWTMSRPGWLPGSARRSSSSL